MTTWGLSRGGPQLLLPWPPSSLPRSRVGRCGHLGKLVNEALLLHDLKLQEVDLPLVLALIEVVQGAGSPDDPGSLPLQHQTDHGTVEGHRTSRSQWPSAAGRSSAQPGSSQSPSPGGPRPGSWLISAVWSGTHTDPAGHPESLLHLGHERVELSVPAVRRLSKPAVTWALGSRTLWGGDEGHSCSHPWSPRLLSG